MPNEAGTTTIDSSTLMQNEVYGGSNGDGSGPTGPVTTNVTNSTLSGTDVYGIGGTTSLSDTDYIERSSGTVELFGTIDRQSPMSWKHHRR